MKMKLGIFLATIAAIIFTGCATTKKIDWNSRIGNYTFDQAVVDFGPPDKQQRLTDGKNVVEWITRRSQGGSVSVGTGFFSGPAGVGIVNSTGPTYYEQKLRLTFDTNGLLSAWSKKY